MSETVGEVKVALVLDSGGIDAGAGSKAGSLFGNAWSVAAGSLIADALKKIAGTVVNVGKDIIQTGMNFEKGMSEVKAVSGANADELDRLQKKGIDSASTSVFTTGQVADAYKYMGMAGWDAGQMIDGLDGILNLAAASNLDLGRTSDIVTDGLTAFGYAAKDSGHFADVLATVSSKANTNVDMLGESFKYVGPVAGAMGYSVEDVSVALGIMANSGIKASQAGTTLRGMLSRMAKPTGEVKDAMDKLGISMFDSSGKARPLNDVMVDLREAFSGLDDKQKAEYATTIAGKNAMSGFLAIVGASDEDFNNMTEAIANADGAAQNMADTMLDNLAGSITKMQSSWDAAKTSLYTGDFDGFVVQLGQAFEGLEGIVSNGADTIADVLPRAMEAIANRLPSFGETLGTAIGKLVPALVKGLMGMLPDLIKGGLKLITSFMKQMAVEFPTYIPEVIQSIMEAFMELTSPDNLNQLIQAGLEMLMGLLQGITDALPVIIEALPVIIENIVTVLLDNLPLILEVGVQLILGLIQGLTSAFPKLVSMVPDIIIKIVTTLVAHLPEILTTGIKILIELITGIVQTFGQLQETAKKIPGEVIQKIKDALPELLEKGSEMLGKLVEGIKNVWEKITTAASDIFHAIVDKVTEMPGKLFDKGKEMLQKLVDGIKNVFQKIKDVAKDIFNAVVDKVKKIPGEMLNAGKDIVEGLWNGINDKIQWLKDKVSGFAGGVVDAVKGALGIHSPSTVFRDEVGSFLAQGIAVGFEEELTSATKEMRKALEGSWSSSLLEGADIPEPQVSTSMTSLAQMALNLDGEENEPMETQAQPLYVTLEMDGQQIQQVILQDVRRSS